MSHSIISPSSASCWRYCPAYPKMEQRHPEDETHALSRTEGEASHEIGALIIKRATQGLETDPTAGDLAPNGVVLTDTIIEGAKLYADDVISEMRSRGVFNPHVEELVECREIHPQSFGTPDCWLYDPRGARLIIWDYKFGFIPVQAYENWQGINYYAGISEQLKVDGALDQILSVEFRIIQPRAYDRYGTIRKWSILASDLRPYVNQLASSARIAMSPNPPAISGKQCRYCRGRHDCEAGLIAGLELFEASSSILPLDASPLALGLQLKLVKRAIEQLKALETGYTEAIYALLKNGTGVPYWTNAPSKGREEWTAPIEEVIAVGDLLNVEVKKPSLITPRQARLAGLPDSIVSQLTERKSTYKLEPINENKVKEIFK